MKAFIFDLTGYPTLLDDLRAIGNAAAHSNADTTFTKDDALHFVSLADQVISRLSPPMVAEIEAS